MSKLDPFAAQLVDMVRQMPDETLLELIRYQLAGAGEAVAAAPAPAAAAAPKAAAKPRAKAKAKPKAKAKAEAKVEAKAEAKPKPPAKAKAKPKAKAKGKQAESGGEEFLTSVEKLVNSSNGVAVADIAKGLSVPKSRAASAVRQLKQAKRIFQGGDRRFARYASSLEKAKAASDRARGKA